MMSVMAFMSVSIDVALVAMGGGEIADIILRRLASLPALLGDDANQGLVDVGRERLGIAADVEMGAVLEPGVEIPGLLDHAVLDVDLARPIAIGVAREGDVHL